MVKDMQADQTAVELFVVAVRRLSLIHRLSLGSAASRAAHHGIQPVATQNATRRIHSLTSLTKSDIPRRVFNVQMAQRGVS
jgi:hypothetical protein